MNLDAITPQTDPHQYPLTCPVCHKDTLGTGLNCDNCGELNFDSQGNWFAVDPEYAAEMHAAEMHGGHDAKD